MARWVASIRWTPSSPWAAGWQARLRVPNFEVTLYLMYGLMWLRLLLGHGPTTPPVVDRRLLMAGPGLVAEP